MQTNRMKIPSCSPPGCQSVVLMASMHQSSASRPTLVVATAPTCKLEGSILSSLQLRLGNRLERFVGDYDEMDCQCAVMRNRWALALGTASSCKKVTGEKTFSSFFLSKIFFPTPLFPLLARTQAWGEKPMCTSSGTYRRRQCKDGMCYCVDR